MIHFGKWLKKSWIFFNVEVADLKRGWENCSIFLGNLLR
jgi:hypothetical protein